MSDPAAFKDFAANAVTQDIEAYETRAISARRGFLWRVAVTRLLGALALVMVLISATRLDQIALQFSRKPVDQELSNRLGLVITAVALLLGAVTVWWARAVRDRGTLRAWVRYSLTAQTLRAHLHEIELAWHRFSALPAPTDDERKKAIDDISTISSQAKQATLEETKTWATNVTEDLAQYLQGALRIAETVDEARERTKPGP